MTEISVPRNTAEPSLIPGTYPSPGPAPSHLPITDLAELVGDGRGTAVVVGSSMAGCLAAVALRRVAKHIILVERNHRGSVPQAGHAHLFLESGLRTLEQMLPGINEELKAVGAVDITMGRDLAWHNGKGWMAKHSGETYFLSCSRSELDRTVRSRVLAEDPAIHYLPGVEVVGLLGSPRAVTGVRLRRRGAPATEVAVAAELTVAATGRGEQVTTWLSDLGCPPTPEQRVNANCTYISRFYDRPADDFEFAALYMQTRPGSPYTGCLLPVENNRWIVSLGTMGKPHPPRGEEGFNALLAQLPDTVMREVLQDAEPATTPSGNPIAPSGFAAGPSVRRDLRKDPPGLIRIGDDADTKNPAHGQGMSTLALAAQSLCASFSGYGDISHAAQLAARRASMAVTRPAWLLSVSEDARLPDTIGAHRTPTMRAQHRYLDAVLHRATQSARVSAAFASVLSLTAPTTVLLQPAMLGRVLLGIG